MLRTPLVGTALLLAAVTVGGADGRLFRPLDPRLVEATSLLGHPLIPPEPSTERRLVLEGNLARARADFEKDPASADAAIWLGRRLAYLGRYREAIEVFTHAIARHPQDARLLRHRGHRFISTRRFDEAIADFTRASQLIAGRADEIEPDGDPNPQNIPTSTLHFNVWYHLGLAHYLKGDFESALAAYQRCLEVSRRSDDRLVATSDWLYMTLRRLGRDEEAKKVLLPIHKDLKVIENTVYHRRLLFYKGEISEAALMEGGDGVAVATQGYGLGNWWLYNGQPERARATFGRVLEGPQWSAFGYIAAEAELSR